MKIATGGILATSVAIISYNVLSGDGGASERFPEPDVYKFKDEDDTLCRTNFRIIGTWYQEAYRGYRETEKQNKEMYDDLLEALEDNRVELVDNQDFLLWAQS